MRVFLNFILSTNFKVVINIIGTINQSLSYYKTIYTPKGYEVLTEFDKFYNEGLKIL